MASINERFLDFQVAQQIRWIRLQNREAREALRILNRVDQQLAAVLRDVDPTSTRYTDARLVALRAQVENIVRTIHSQIASEVTGAVRDAAVAAGELEAATLKRILPVGVDVTTPNLGVLQTAVTLKPFNGAVLADWGAQLVQGDVDRTWRSIFEGITDGTTTDDLIRSLNGTRSLRYKDGVREVSRRGLETFVRTSINHATNQGRQAAWEANRDIVKGIQWVATLDNRTTPICQSRDGRVGPITADGPVPEGDPLDPIMARPPAHPNCRSTTVAITKSWRELGFDVDDLPPATRASMDGKVPAKTTYFQWLNKQASEVQKDVMGPTRWAMWKEKGVSPDRFINDKGRLLTIEEIRKSIRSQED